MNPYDLVKSLHIIFVVSWFAGLFYIVRLFIYHTEAQEDPEPKKGILSEQFVVMERKLWWIITTPAMVLTLLFGSWMVWLNPALLKMPWLHLKLGFVALLLVYHFVCQRILKNLAKGIFRWKSQGLRMWNEVATLALVSIVFIVVTKGQMNWWKGVIGFFATAIGLMILIRLYKKFRR